MEGIVDKASLSLLLLLAAGTACCLGAVELSPTDVVGLRAENDALKARVAKLEEQMLQIQQMLVAGTAQPAVAAAAPAPAAAAPSEPLPGVKVYGQIELDTTSDSTTNMLPLMTASQSPVDNRVFDVSARPTRFGFLYAGPKVAGAKASGKLEADFFTSTGTTFSPNLRLRHGYFRLDWENQGISFLAGQTYDLVGYLQPDTISYPVESWVGDIGYRRPQFRVEKKLGLTGTSKLTMQAALSKITSDIATPTRVVTATMLAPQVRFELDVPLFGPNRTLLGIYGHYGRQAYHVNPSDSALVETWSAGLDATINLTPKLQFMGECWTGAPLNLYYYNELIQPVLLGNLDSTGGWGQFTWFPTRKLRFNVGGGFEDPVKTVQSTQQATYALSLFGNGYYDFSDRFEVGLELSWWRQEDDTENSQELTRLQTMFLYKF